MIFNINDMKGMKQKDMFIVLIVLVVIVLVYGFLFKYLGGIDAGNSSMHLLKIFLLGVFTFLVLVNGLKYFFDYDIIEVPEDESNKVTEEVIKEENKIKDDRLMFSNEGDDSLNQMGTQKEVFHIGDNIYTYDEAKVICNAYDGDLANYDQIEQAYNSGAEWCSYGWSKDQMALYPTQKLTYEKLKKIPGLENSCGRPGINGGYIKNPKVRFGVNCYGIKGSPSTKERQEMMFQKNQQINLPKTENAKKLDFYKRNIRKIVKKPFNKNKWSLY